jgi:hypothetical protein
MPSVQECTSHILVRNNMNQKANSLDPDQTAWIFQLIWIYTVRPCNKGVSMEERVEKRLTCPRKLG